MHISAVLVSVTGFVYAWMRYIIVPRDEFSVVGHHLQPTIQHLHVLAAPIFVLMIGVFWQSHAIAHWVRNVREGRYSGIGQLIVVVPMIFSAYLLQTATSGAWRLIWVWLHIVTSLIWVFMYLLHFVTHLREKYRRGRIKP